jgi:hypothetical protein
MSDCILENNSKLTRALFGIFWKMQFDPIEQQKKNKKSSKSKKKTRDFFK